MFGFSRLGSGKHPVRLFTLLFFGENDHTVRLREHFGIYHIGIDLIPLIFHGTSMVCSDVDPDDVNVRELSRYRGRHLFLGQLSYYSASTQDAYQMLNVLDCLMASITDAPNLNTHDFEFLSFLTQALVAKRH